MSCAWPWPLPQRASVKVLERVAGQGYDGMKAAADLPEPGNRYYGLDDLGAEKSPCWNWANAYATLAQGGRRPARCVLPTRSRGNVWWQPAFSPQAGCHQHSVGRAARATVSAGTACWPCPFPWRPRRHQQKLRDTGPWAHFRLVVAVWAGNFGGKPWAGLRHSGSRPAVAAGLRLRPNIRGGRIHRPPGGRVQICRKAACWPRPCPCRRTETFIAGMSLPAIVWRICLLSVEAAFRTAPPGLAILHPQAGERYLYDPGMAEAFRTGASGPDRSDTDSLTGGWRPGRGRISLFPPDSTRPPEFFWPLRRGGT